MFRKSLVLCALAAALSLPSCSNYLAIQEENRQRETLAAAVVRSSPRTFTIRVLPFKMTGREVPDAGYIRQAVTEILSGYLKPLQYETVFIPFEYVTNEEITGLIMLSNSRYSNYVTNVETVVTQFSQMVETETRAVVTTNSNLTETPGRRAGTVTNVWVYTLTTNLAERQVTNTLASNVITTNLRLLTLSAYSNLVDTEFPELTNSLSRVPVVIRQEPILTNLAVESEDLLQVLAGQLAAEILRQYTNGNTYRTVRQIADFLGVDIARSLADFLISEMEKPTAYYGFVYGSYSVTSRKNGPNDVSVKMTVMKHVVSNRQIDLELKSREDLLADRLFDFLKPTREFFLDRPVADLAVLTDPSDANIYLNGVYLGKSPLYYPAIPTGPYHMTFLKQGYAQTTVDLTVVHGRTNFVTKKIDRMKTGGEVTILSEPTNANVFIESEFRGNTPLVVSNLTLDTEHRVKILAQDTNLPAYYHSFRLKDEEDRYRINARILANDTLQSFVRELLFWTTVGSWTGVVGLVGWNIYTHYMSEYYLDLYLVGGASGDYARYLQYFQLNESAFTYFLIGSGVAFGVTALSLYNSEVYLGMDYSPRKGASAHIAYRF